LKTQKAEKLWQAIDTGASLFLGVLVFGGLLLSAALWYSNPRLGFLMALTAVLSAAAVLYRLLWPPK
jgi:hypothetical protein